MAALVTPEQLIVYLDLPAGVQPYDRAQLVCDLVTAAVTQHVPTGTAAEPWPAAVAGVALPAAARLYDNPAALRSFTVGSTSGAYAGDVASLLTPAEVDRIGRAYGASSTAPVGKFPPARRWPDPIRIDC